MKNLLLLTMLSISTAFCAEIPDEDTQQPRIIYIHGFAVDANKVGDIDPTARLSVPKFISEREELPTSLSVYDFELEPRDAYVPYVLSALKNEPKLATVTSLKLSRGRLTETGAEILAQFLASNTTLLSLDLSYNSSIGIRGATALLAALHFNTTLKTLDLGKAFDSDLFEIRSMALFGATPIKVCDTTQLLPMFQTNSTLTSLGDVHDSLSIIAPEVLDVIDRNKKNEEKRSLSLFHLLADTVLYPEKNTPQDPVSDEKPEADCQSISDDDFFASESDSD